MKIAEKNRTRPQRPFIPGRTPLVTNWLHVTKVTGKYFPVIPSLISSAIATFLLRLGAGEFRIPRRRVGIFNLLVPNGQISANERLSGVILKRDATVRPARRSSWELDLCAPPATLGPMGPPTPMARSENKGMPELPEFRLGR